VLADGGNDVVANSKRGKKRGGLAIRGTMFELLHEEDC